MRELVSGLRRRAGSSRGGRREDLELHLRLLRQARGHLWRDDAREQHGAVVRPVAGAVEHRRGHDHRRPVLGLHDALRGLALPDRVAERVRRIECVGGQEPIVQFLVRAGLQALAPYEMPVVADERDDVEPGGDDGRRRHVVFDERRVPARHVLVGLEPVAPVGAERLQLRELAVDGAGHALHVGAREVRLERLEAGQDDLALHRVVDRSVRREQRAEQQDHLGIEAHLRSRPRFVLSLPAQR